MTILKVAVAALVLGAGLISASSTPGFAQSLRQQCRAEASRGSASEYRARFAQCMAAKSGKGK